MRVNESAVEEATLMRVGRSRLRDSRRNIVEARLFAEMLERAGN